MNTRRFSQAITYLITLTFLLASCTPFALESTATPSITSVPTNTTTPTTTPTFTPTTTPTFTPTITPNLALPVSLMTPAPSSNTQIGSENVKGLREIARYYGVRAYREQYYLQFIDNSKLSFKNFDAHSLDKYSCNLSILGGTIACSSHSPLKKAGKWIGSDLILGTDGQYYSYTVSNTNVEIHLLTNPSQIYYSLPWQGYTFNLRALDPVNNLVFYSIALTPNINKEIIQDMKNNRILAKWEGETYLSPIVFSDNKKLAAICRNKGYDNRPFSDELFVFDLTQKKIIYNIPFSCSGAAIALSQDGSRLATEFMYRYSTGPDDIQYTRIMVVDTFPPYQNEKFDIEATSGYAIGFSPDEKLLVVSCYDHNICFLDPSNGQEIYRLEAYPGIESIAFSPDGTIMATSADSGVLSLWGIPPFNFGQPRSDFGDLPGFTTLDIPPLLFVYPLDGQTLNYFEDYRFRVTPVSGADGYLWGFFQNGKGVYESYEGTPSSNVFVIPKGSAAHKKFSPGPLEIWVRAFVNGQYTDATIITVYLLEDAPTSTPPPISMNTLTP